MMISVWMLSDNILPTDESVDEFVLCCVNPSLQMERDSPPCFSYIMLYQKSQLSKLAFIEYLRKIGLSKLQFSPLRFCHFCEFHPNVCFFVFGSLSFQNLVIFILEVRQSIATFVPRLWPSAMKIARFQTFSMKNKPLDESHESGQTSGTKMTFYSIGFVLTSERPKKSLG
ncbi:hypothetical protein Hanom_Chr05g00469481 [Helianthus anomalus]